MKIQDRDKDLLRAWCTRESYDYRWRMPQSQRDFIDKIENEINEILSEELFGADYVILESCSNMGLTTRELHLTPTPWESGSVYRLIMPPSPVGGIGHGRSKR